ncbi:flavonol 4'-sulfotransferase-like [Quercus suber]|uniref:flavonol 4'-sulfotransferase-like n=1 Tax=Quercus suber TaxID=58331 RepID=UPI0032DE7631
MAFFPIQFKLSSNSQKLDLDIPLVATHIPYTSLPKSVINSSCKIVYICRDPKTVFVSLWHFSNKLSPKAPNYVGPPLPMKKIHLRDAFEFFCEGLSIFGPYWDHVLGYWSPSLESPERILFLKYEDLKNETVYWVKEIAQFIGYPFSLKEEEKFVVQKTINLCSFEKLSSLEVNTSGIIQVRAI